MLGQVRELTRSLPLNPRYDNHLSLLDVRRPEDYRGAVFEALRKGGYEVLAMEDYVATDRRPVDKCLADVAGADLYVGLFAFRYGYVPPPEHNNPKGLSITELEFRHADELRKPCLTFVVNDTTPWPRSFDDARTGEDKGDRVNRLRQHLLTEKIGQFFFVSASTG